MIEKTKLKITTVTPVTIGSGAELSPYSDYIVDNGQICFIDKTKLQNIIATNDSWLDLYVQGVAMQMDNNKSDFDIKSFLLNNKIVTNIDEVISYRCDFTTNTPQSKLPIKGIIKSPLQQPYFPGSSIKGGLKTVFMYNWLKTNKKSDAKIEEVINGKEIEKNGEFKKIAVNFDWLEKLFECKVNEETNILIRPNTIQQATDSKPLSKDSNIVVDCWRKMPIRFECIAKDKTTEFELTLENYKWNDLVEQMNDYAFDVLNRELDLVEKDDKLKIYYNQLLDMQDLINDELEKSESSTAYLRIGFGKGYYLNSLGIAIYDYVTKEGKEDLYDKYESFLKKEFAKRGKEDDFSLENFPKTRLFVSKTQEPLGWVKIERI
jgi:CRISPR-associated protein Csm5